MAEALQEPEAYAERLAQYCARLPAGYVRPTKLTLERMTNAHPETNGRRWGWYEIFPLRIIVGYWGSDRDDLKHVNQSEWNARAKERARFGVSSKGDE